jgi:hypothetical protein
MLTVNVQPGRLSVTAFIIATGQEIAKAYRVDLQHDWFIGVRMNALGHVGPEHPYRVIGTVSNSMPEVMQRKLILAILDNVLPAAINVLG